MNKFLSIFALAFATLMLSSFTQPNEGLDWKDFNEGYAKAKKEKKIALIDAYTEWCGWCKKMDRDTYANAGIAEKIKKNFVPIKFNPELDQQYTLDGKTYSGMELLSILSNRQQSGYPTTFFIITTTKKILIEVGYQNATQFAITLDKMVAAANGSGELVPEK